VAGRNGAQAYECRFGGDRMQVRRQAVQAAFELLIEAMQADAQEK